MTVENFFREQRKKILEEVTQNGGLYCVKIKEEITFDQVLFRGCYYPKLGCWYLVNKGERI